MRTKNKQRINRGDACTMSYDANMFVVDSNDVIILRKGTFVLVLARSADSDIVSESFTYFPETYVLVFADNKIGHVHQSMLRVFA